MRHFDGALLGLIFAGVVFLVTMTIFNTHRLERIESQTQEIRDVLVAPDVPMTPAAIPAPTWSIEPGNDGMVG
jgi:hypothetical protein